MGVEGKNKAIQPMGGEVSTDSDNSSDRSIAIFDWIGRRAGQRADGGIGLHGGGKLTTVEEHLRTGADGRDDGGNQ